jgi:hypothetical protein
VSNLYVPAFASERHKEGTTLHFHSQPSQQSMIYASQFLHPVMQQQTISCHKTNFSIVPFCLYTNLHVEL